MHLGETRHQILPLRLDDLDVVAHLDLIGRVNRRDPPVGDDDGLVFQHDRATRPGHRQHGDTDERQVTFDHRQRVDMFGSIAVLMKVMKSVFIMIR